MRTLLLSLALACAATGAWASDEPMSTAGSGSAPAASTETAAQIDRWLADSPAASEQEPLAPMRRIDDPRKIHGEMSVGVGTGGYRSVSGVATIPIGESGSATIALGKTDYGNRVRPVYFGPVGTAGPYASPIDGPYW